MVKRLVYAPRAFAFIYSSNLNKIIDVSDDIVSGWVDRLDNDMSKAELVLRNSGRKYIRTLADAEVDGRRIPKGTQVFQWDDLITIWLQRLPGQPVQVFTGYLDSVPGWQMYPGDCRIEASCTMKRLAYSWFDPGSAFFMNMASQRGWTYNPDSGQGYVPEIYTDPNDPTAQAPLDGGMSGFLFQFLTEVADWDQRMVMVGELDPTLIQKASDLREDQLDMLRDDMDAYKEVMRRFIGIDAIDAAEVGGVRADGTVNATITRRVRAIQKSLGTSRIPLQFAVMAGVARSALNPSYQKGVSAGPDGFGVGLFRLQPDFASDGDDMNWEGGVFGNPQFELGDGEGYLDTIYGRDPSAYVGSINLSMQVFKAKFNKAISHYYPDGPTAENWALVTNKLETDSRFAAQTMVEMGLGVNDDTAVRAFDEANRYIRAVVGGEAVAQPTSETTEREPLALEWDSPELLELNFDESEKQALARYQSHHKSLIPYLYFAKNTLGEDVKLTYPTGIHKESLYLTGDIHLRRDGENEDRPTGQGWHEGALVELYRKFRGHEEVSSVTMSADDLAFRYLMREGVESSSTDSGTRLLKTNSIRIVMTKETVDPPPSWVGLPTEVNTEDNVLSNDGFSFQQLGQFSTVAALQAQYTFAAADGVAGSTLLTNNRALMNDISCLDAAKQLAQGSMRNFMSLPNGRLCAYYPDYFGARRGPYWYVREIEIINMGIQLTDGPLATHVYVTGDTVGPTFNGSIDLIERVLSRGVVSVFDVELLNAFMVPGVLTTPADGQASSRRTAFDATKARDFLNKHGMRPLKEENPIIKNPWYEFLMAWQRFMQQWAATYDTRVEFTFQPEVMAGGIIGFREHGLQMYCKQVRHEFSYESGFSTSATLTAPAAIYDPRNPNQTDPSNLPGMVIAGGINTVGGAG